MDSGGLTRRTLAGEPLTAFPIKQFWLKNDCTGDIWWDLEYLFSHLRDKAVTIRKRNKWLAHVQETLSSTPATSETCHLHLHRADQPASYVQANACTTIGVFVVLAKCIDEARSAQGVEVPCRVFRDIAPASCSTLQGPRVFSCTWGEFSVDCDGRMHGWQLLCSGLAGHATTLLVVERLWDSLHAAGTVCGPFQCENHSLADVVVFACAVGKQRRSENRPQTKQLCAFQERCVNVMLSCLGKLVSDTVRARYCDDGNDAVMRAPPAIRTTTCKRNYVTIGAEAAWDMLEKAMAAGTSVETALDLKSDEDAYDRCSTWQGRKWTNFAVQLYFDRCSALFLDGVNHFNFVSDPGHHSYKECLVSLAYSWEQDWHSGLSA